jgi:hypothetical protein
MKEPLTLQKHANAGAEGGAEKDGKPSRNFRTEQELRWGGRAEQSKTPLDANGNAGRGWFLVEQEQGSGVL